MLWMLMTYCVTALQPEGYYPFACQYRIQPAGDKVLVRTAGAEEQTPSGFVLPKVAQKKPTEGEVIAISEAKLVKVSS